MKNMPDMTIAEIAQEFLDRSGFTLEQIQGTKGHGQELMWVRAKIIVAASKAGWGDSAIGRYLGVGHDYVWRHRRENGGKNTSDQPA